MSKAEIKGDKQKPVRTPPSNGEIAAVVGQNSDFAFEMSVLRMLTSLGFACEHSGTYVDPIKAKNREFDIRGLKIFDTCTRLSIAVECKNIAMSPLVVHRVPRQINESYHEILQRDEKDSMVGIGPHQFYSTSTIRLDANNTPYQPYLMVGKAMDQVVPDGREGWKLSDGEIFDKFSQALNSLASLVASALSNKKTNCRTALLAFLVVPDGSLWASDYSEKGAPQGEPKQVDHVQYFVGKTYEYQAPSDGLFTLTHLEILTPTAIGTLVVEYCRHYVNHAPLFPQDGALRL